MVQQLLKAQTCTFLLPQSKWLLSYLFVLFVVFSCENLLKIRQQIKKEKNLKKKENSPSTTAGINWYLINEKLPLQ